MWISSLNLDLVQCTLVCVTTLNPDAPHEAFRVEFEEVGRVTIDRYHDADQIALADFAPFVMRAAEMEGRAIFEIDTGDARVRFEAAAEPRIVPGTMQPEASEVFMPVSEAAG